MGQLLRSNYITIPARSLLLPKTRSLFHVNYENYPWTTYICWTFSILTENVRKKWNEMDLKEKLSELGEKRAEIKAALRRKAETNTNRKDMIFQKMKKKTVITQFQHECEGLSSAFFFRYTMCVWGDADKRRPQAISTNIVSYMPYKRLSYIQYLHCGFIELIFLDWMWFGWHNIARRFNWCQTLCSNVSLNIWWKNFCTAENANVALYVSGLPEYFILKIENRLNWMDKDKYLWFVRYF